MSLLGQHFISVLEQKYVNDCPSQFTPILYHLYVDDTFCLFKDSKDVDLFLHCINNAHPIIQFTVEIENSGSLLFLDILVGKSANGFD